jgi:hypothetical protein
MNEEQGERSPASEVSSFLWCTYDCKANPVILSHERWLTDAPRSVTQMRVDTVLA